MMALPRGAIVTAFDTLTNHKTARPHAVINTSHHPKHGKQYILLPITTKNRDGDAFEIQPDDFLTNNLSSEQNYVVPWRIETRYAKEIDKQIGMLKQSFINTICTEISHYLLPSQATASDTEPSPSTQRNRI